MKYLYSILVPLFLFCSSLYSQKTNKNLVYPFKKIFENIDTLTVRTRRVKSTNDTLYKQEIIQLSKQPFENKNIEVENYGVTPDGSISIFSRGERIVLIGRWIIDDKFYAINISVKERLKYHGLLIEKQIFDRLFKQ